MFKAGWQKLRFDSECSNSSEAGFAYFLRLFVRSGAHFALVRNSGRVQVTNCISTGSTDFSESTEEQQRPPRKRIDKFSERVEYRASTPKSPVLTFVSCAGQQNCG